MERVEAVADDIVAALGRLLPQLNPDLAPPSRSHLERVVADPAATLLVARVNGEIAGTATVSVFASPAKVSAHVDDVVVDSEQRAMGVGEALMKLAIEHARQAGANVVRLTSADHRADAHRLYERLGFRQVTSRLYRLDLE